MKWLVIEVRTVKVGARTKEEALTKGRLVLENFAPDTIDLSAEPVEVKPS